MIRLYPDIIVVAEINNIRRLNLMLCNSEPDNVILSVKKLVKTQEAYLQFGIEEGVMIGYEGEYWNKDDYIQYFQCFSKYFQPKTDDLWEVRFDLILDEKSAKYNRILMHGYPEDVWRKLGLKGWYWLL